MFNKCAGPVPCLTSSCIPTPWLSAQPHWSPWYFWTHWEHCLLSLCAGSSSACSILTYFSHLVLLKRQSLNKDCPDLPYLRLKRTLPISLIPFPIFFLTFITSHHSKQQAYYVYCLYLYPPIKCKHLLGWDRIAGNVCWLMNATCLAHSTR